MTLFISWSSLQRYEGCRQKHYRTIRKETVRQPFTRDYLPGTIADRIERAWLDSPDPQPGEMLKMLPEWFERFTNPDANYEEFSPFKWKGNPREDREQVYEFVTGVITKLEPMLLRYVIPHDYAAEQSFKVVVGIPYLDGNPVGVKLLGRIDIVTRLRHPDMGFETGDFVLYDLKATKNDAYINKTLGQGTFYDIGWNHFFGAQPKRFGFIAPALEQQLWWSDITDADRTHMVSRIIAMAQGMWRGEWEPKTDDTGCQWCEARHACTKFATHLVTDDVGKRRISFEKSVEERARQRGFDGTARPVEEGTGA